MKHFTEKEFRCKCGCGLGFKDMDPELLRILDETREAMGSPMRINSAVRCETHNKTVKGSERSEHVPKNTHKGKCTGVDIHIPNSSYLHSLIGELYKHGVPRIGWNQRSSFIHIGLSENHPRPVFFKY